MSAGADLAAMHGAVTIMGWVDDFCESPMRLPSMAPKRTPHSLLKAATRAQVRKLAYLGSRPLIQPQYVGYATLDKGHGKMQKYKVGNPGSGDDLCIFFGRVVALEYKAGADRQRDSQKRWQALFERAGGIYVIVRTPKDAIDALMKVYEDAGGKKAPY